MIYLKYSYMLFLHVRGCLGTCVMSACVMSACVIGAWWECLEEGLGRSFD